MKKIALLLVLVLLLSFTLTSCASVSSFVEATRGKLAWRKINKVMSSMESYTSSTTGKLRFKIDDVKAEYDLSGYMKYISSGDDLYLIEKYNISGSIGSEEINNSQTIAYDDGEMFISDKTGDDIKKFRSKITSEEFIEYYTENSIGVFIEEAGKIEYNKQKKSNTIEIVMSEFSKDEIIRMTGGLGVGEFLYGSKISDMTVKVIADENYRVTKMEYKVISKGSEDPVIELTKEYGEYGNVKAGGINKTEYTELEDVRLIGKVERFLADKMLSDSAAFKVKTKYTYNTGSSYTQQSATENCFVSYSATDDGFSYNVECTGLGITGFTASYADGIETVTQKSGDKTENKMTDLEAYATVVALMNYSGFSYTYIYDMTVIDDNTVVFKCDPDGPVTVKNVFDSSTVTRYTRTDWEVTVIFEGDEIKEISSSMILYNNKKITVVSGQETVTYDSYYKIECVVEF